MKTSSKFTLLSLTVLSCVSCKEITVRGHEVGNAVINCPYQKGYESYPKYLTKGEFKDRVEIIRSHDQRKWTDRGRVSLQDNKDNKFTVTIHNLTLEDAGIYWCGVDTWGRDTYTSVKLTVVRQANKPTAAIPTVTAEVTTVTLSNTVPVSTHNTTTAPLTNITESERTESDPTSAASGGHLANLSGGLVVAVVIFALLVVTFRLMKRRAEKKRALPTPLSGNIRPDSCVYSEIQPTSPHATDGPDQSDQRSSPALTSIYALVTPPAPVPAQHHKAANQLPQPTTASDDIYSLATNLTQALHSGVTSVTNQHEPGPATAATGGDVINSIAINLMPSLPTRTSVSSTTNHQSDPAIYCNLTSANENPDGSEYATVVFRDEPIGSDSASVSFSKSGASPL
ncbi:CMRF35-like molecule 1 isoform X2 [Alosa alosa]|uniref:CMRF35-like molecule 1 isoform X2 n=1 Tax=Alosa alosa TaxID=278164 RepID=UPI00201521F4|nr:CMRF35-like molecule 1 isoform X2 [Alosa alosa]